MTLRLLYDRLFAALGPQGWWPAETPFEVIVGAVLTQNTAWRNVERAIANLRQAQALSPEVLAGSPTAFVEQWIRPAGFYRQKARRLAAVAHHVLQAGGMQALARAAREDPVRERQRWLAVPGVGPETADSILLYAFHVPMFVVDAYTKRILVRLGMADPEARYEELQARFHAALPREAPLFNEYHALFVALGKDHCRARPRCAGCPLRTMCPTAPLHTEPRARSLPRKAGSPRQRT